MYALSYLSLYDTIKLFTVVSSVEKTAHSENDGLPPFIPWDLLSFFLPLSVRGMHETKVRRECEIKEALAHISSRRFLSSLFVD